MASTALFLSSRVVSAPVIQFLRFFVAQAQASIPKLLRKKIAFRSVN
jgi:hypothetical protein